MRHYVLVCGGRDFDCRDDVKQVLELLQWVYEGELRVMHGDARGADRLAGQVAAELGVVTRAFPADWQTHGKAAGPIRNERMLEYLLMCERRGHSVEVLAFRGGRGTADMIKRAEGAGVPVSMLR